MPVALKLFDEEPWLATCVSALVQACVGDVVWNVAEVAGGVFRVRAITILFEP